MSTDIGGCTKDCTVDRGRCKGDPLGMIQRRIMRGLGWSRNGHGGIPFDKKDVWDDGYREAMRAVRRVLYPAVNGGSGPNPQEATRTNASSGESASAVPES